MESQGKILIVDDYEAHRLLIARALRKAGISQGILEASTMTHARQVIFESAETLRLLIIDLNLTDGRGSALIREIRSVEKLTDVPVIILSTSNLERDVGECLQNGASCYLIKSPDPLIFANDITLKVSSLLL